MTNGSYFVDSRAIEGQKFIASKVIAKITFLWSVHNGCL